VNYNDFLDWKRHPVTQAIFSQLQDRIDFWTDELIEQTAYTSQTEMAEKAGAIKAVRDVLNIEYEKEAEDGR
jgi:hypothetical protein